MAACAVNGIKAVFMVITLVFTLGDIISILYTDTGYPFLQLFYNTVKNKSAVNAMAFLITFILSNCAITETATASQQIWAFSRDNGLPGSTWLSKASASRFSSEVWWEQYPLTMSVQVSPGQNIPLRAVIVSFIVTTLLSLINIGSYVALNAINSFGAVAVIASYLIVISCMIWRRLYGEP